jgi:hypothetical protein
MCWITYFICGEFVKRTFGPVNNDEPHACVPYREQVFPGLDKLFVCCSRLRETKDKGQARDPKGNPCDLETDLDCDGVPNKDDDYPGDPNCSSHDDKCAAKYKKT